MKVGRILIVMIFATLGFTANAQRGVYASNSGDYFVQKYAYALNLRKSQIVDWTDLNRYYDDQFQYVLNDNGLSPRVKQKKVNRLYEQRDYDLRKILTNRQYRKLSTMRSFQAYNRPSSRNYGNSGRYDSYYSNQGYYGNNRGYNRGSRGSYCPSY